MSAHSGSLGVHSRRSVRRHLLAGGLEYLHYKQAALRGGVGNIPRAHSRQETPRHVGYLLVHKVEYPKRPLICKALSTQVDSKLGLSMGRLGGT